MTPMMPLIKSGGVTPHATTVTPQPPARSFPAAERHRPVQKQVVEPALALRFGQEDPEEPPPSLPALRKKLRKYTALAILGLGAMVTSASYTTYQSVKNLISTHTQLSALDAEQAELVAKHQAAEALRREIWEGLTGKEAKGHHDAVHRIAHLETDGQKVCVLLRGFVFQPKQVLAHQSYLLRKIKDPELREAVSEIFEAHREWKKTEVGSSDWLAQERQTVDLMKQLNMKAGVHDAFSLQEVAKYYRGENN